MKLCLLSIVSVDVRLSSVVIILWLGFLFDVLLNFEVLDIRVIILVILLDPFFFLLLSLLMLMIAAWTSTDVKST